MRRVIFALALLVVPSVSQAYYWDERVSERSFEQSELYFRSYFLNTFGLHRFQDVAVGIIDDPFLDLHLNPANLPRIEGGSSLLYFDFRGDRTEAPIIEHYYTFLDYGPYVMPDPRYYSTSRREPEPVFSFGLLAYPFRAGLRKLFVGGTYQVIYEEEPYYTPPIWIYRAQFGYDTFGGREFDSDTQIPVQQRYFGEDELSTEGHLYSIFAGYPLTRETDVGFGLNAVSHTRDGSYINLRSDEYGQTDNWDYRYYEERSRNQEYDHVDFSGGIRHALSRETTAGLKIGYLSGDVDQTDMTVDSSLYTRGDSLQERYWNRYYRRSTTRQNWNRDGNTFYARASFEHEIEKGRRVSGYYRYSKQDIDLENSTRISDTSSYASRYRYTYDLTPETRWYNSVSSASDVRDGTGLREERTHQAMMNLKWQMDRKSRVSAGVYFSREETDISSREPVEADRWSSYSRKWIDTVYVADTSFHGRYESKMLDWDYGSRYWTVQVPVMVDFQFNKRFGMTLGVNQILESWKITDRTVALFERRTVTENGDVEEETGFAESYIQPEEKITEEYTAVLASFDATVSPQFVIRLMLEPETEGDFRINQWWLSFRLRL